MRLIASQHIPWKEQIDVNEVEAQCDEYGWDELLEALEGGGDGGAGVSAVSSVQRVSTPMPRFQRQGSAAVKTAAATNWDVEFSNAQAHARDVLAKLGR